MSSGCGGSTSPFPPPSLRNRRSMCSFSGPYIDPWRAFHHPAPPRRRRRRQVEERVRKSAATTGPYIDPWRAFHPVPSGGGAGAQERGDHVDPVQVRRRRRRRRCRPRARNCKSRIYKSPPPTVYIRTQALALQVLEQGQGRRCLRRGRLACGLNYAHVPRLWEGRAPRRRGTPAEFRHTGEGTPSRKGWHAG